MREPRGRNGDPAWSDATDRFEKGMFLFQAGKAPRLVFTAGGVPWFRQPESEGDQLRRAALRRGVPEDAILVTGEVANTADEAREVDRIARQRGWRRIVLVTSAWHLPRAVFLFRHTAATIVPYPADYRTKRREPRTILDFVPQAEALLKSELALREFCGLLYYKLSPAPH